jgi:hypothetical protein
MNAMNRIVFLVDVDNTLLDNDYIQDELKSHLARQYGPACRDRYWAIFEHLFKELGYRDYLGALQRYRVEHPQDMDLLSMSSFLIDYPFAKSLYPHALDVLAKSVDGVQPCSSPMVMSSFSPAKSSDPAFRRPSPRRC